MMSYFKSLTTPSILTPSYVVPVLDSTQATTTAAQTQGWSNVATTKPTVMASVPTTTVPVPVAISDMAPTSTTFVMHVASLPPSLPPSLQLLPTDEPTPYPSVRSSDEYTQTVQPHQLPSLTLTQASSQTPTPAPSQAIVPPTNSWFNSPEWRTLELDLLTKMDQLDADLKSFHMSRFKRQCRLMLPYFKQYYLDSNAVYPHVFKDIRQYLTDEYLIMACSILYKKGLLEEVDEASRDALRHHLLNPFGRS